MKVGKGEDRAPFRLRPTLFRLRLTSHHFLLTSPPSLPSPSYRSSTTLRSARMYASSSYLRRKVQQSAGRFRFRSSPPSLVQRNSAIALNLCRTHHRPELSQSPQHQRYPIHPWHSSSHNSNSVIPAS